MRVLVTRPQPGSARTAARLREAGFEPVLLALTEIRPLPVEPADLPPRPDAVAATSANALRGLADAVVQPLARLPFHAVGKATALAASRAGFTQVFEGPGNAGSLASDIVRNLPGGARLLYLCGRVRMPSFERRLREAGVSVVTLETYDTVGVQWSEADVAAVFGARPIDAILLHSAEAARRLIRLVAISPEARLSPHLRVICLSARIADALGRNLPGDIRVAGEPTEDAMFTELARPAG